MGIGSFMRHSSRSNSRFTSYLGDWKKEGGSIVVWLHRQFDIQPLWLHNVPFIRVKEEGEGAHKTMVKRLVPGNFRCWDVEEVIKNQYNIDENGRRETPPTCPICKLIDYVRVEVTSGRMADTDVLFKITGVVGKYDSEEKTQIIHAGGIYNAWRDVETGTSEHTRLRAAKISLKEAFREVCTAKGNYLLLVVDNSNPGKGVQKMRETALVGDKLRTCIAEMMEKHGEVKGDPSEHPYPFKLKYNEHEKKFGKKYSCIAMDNIKITPEIEKLISGSPPDVKSDIEYFNAKTVRSFLERHAVAKLPWDDIFGDAEVRPVDEESHDDGTSFDTDELEGSPESSPTPEVSTKKSDESSDPNWVKCDNEKCGKPMRINWTRCPACGDEYTIDANENPIDPDQDEKYGPKKDEKKEEPAPPPKRMRSQIKKDEKAGF